MARDSEELALTSTDAQPLTQEVVRDRIEEIVQENLVWREAFMDYPAEGLDSNIVKIPVPDDEDDFDMEVGENANYPREEGDYTEETLEFEKYGFEIPISMEARNDTFLNLTQDQVDRQARRLREHLNEQAWQNIEANSQGPVSDDGGADGTMTYGDIVAGRAAIKADQYDPDLLIADVEAVHDLMADPNFVTASELGDEVRRSGQIGQIIGLDVVEADDDQNITNNDNPGAVLFDTDYFGYEGQKLPITTEQYEEQQSESTIFRAKSRIGWTVIQDEAAVRIEG
jgi:hypothetical protein